MGIKAIKHDDSVELNYCTQNTRDWPGTLSNNSHMISQALQMTSPLARRLMLFYSWPILHSLILCNYRYSMALFSTKPYTVAAKSRKLTIGKPHTCMSCRIVLYPGDLESRT
jgi:hypothetical protein